MSLIKIDHGIFNDCFETRFVSIGGEVNKPLETQYVQYYNGKPIARFKVYEPKRKKIKLIDVPESWIRKMYP